MPILMQTAPASVRMMPANLRDSKGLGIRTTNAVTMTAEARANSKEKSRFSRLPHEPEDARITGITRSLPRRLLALNLLGSLRPTMSVRGVTVATAQVA